jgi:hypothetical protein
MATNIKIAIKAWRKIKGVGTTDDLDHLCLTADAITSWCLNNAPTITAVHDCKELVLRHFRYHDVSENDLRAAFDRSHGACAQIEMVLQRREASSIAPEHRTIPMSLKVAARLLGYTKTTGERRNMKDAAELLRKSIDEGLVACMRLSRQQYIFDRTQFPQESQDKIAPR